MIEVKSCDKCKYYFDCRKGSIANAYGGLECSAKWSNQPEEKQDEIENAWLDSSMTNKLSFEEGYYAATNSLKCCGNCDHYRTIPVKYHLEEYCNIIEDPQERRDIAKYDTKCTNWKQKENL